MSDTALGKRQSLPPPVPPPLDFDVYRQALSKQPATPADPHAQTDNQIKHVGWQVIEAINQQSEPIVGRLKARIPPLMERAKVLPNATKTLLSKFTPFQILGGTLIVTATLVLITAGSQFWFIFAASGAAQLAIDAVLRKKSIRQS